MFFFIVLLLGEVLSIKATWVMERDDQEVKEIDILFERTKTQD